jgi:hypothetical protein
VKEMSSFIRKLFFLCTLQADFDSAATWTPQELFFWRLTMQQLLLGFKCNDDCSSAFARLASQKALGPTCKTLGLFLKTYVGPWLLQKAGLGEGGGGLGSSSSSSSSSKEQQQQQAAKVALGRAADAERVLRSSQGALLASL